MVDHRPRLQLWGSGEYELSSDGADGSSSVLTVRPGGTLIGRTRSRGMVETTLLVTEGVGEQAVWARDSTRLGMVYDPVAKGALDRDWKHEKVIDKQLPDGGRLVITRDGSGKGEYWEAGHRSAGTIKSGGDTWYTPNSDWVTIWHGARREAGGGTSRESVSLGSTHSPYGRESYTTARSVERDGQGHVTRDTSVTDAYDKEDGSRTHGVTITYGDGSFVRQQHRTQKDGTWTDTTTTRDGEGHYVTRHATGHGTTTDTYSEEESDTDPDTSQKDPDPEPPADSPVGDGEPGSEGNPDGPLAGVDIRTLLGPDWQGPDDFDDLGDVDAALRPWLARIAATLAGGVSSGGDRPGELVDSLGAPPIIGFDLSGYEPDEFADHDSLGRPPPIFGTVVEVGAAEVGTGVGVQVGAELGAGRAGALTVGELMGVAATFASSAARVGQSVALLKNR